MKKVWLAGMMLMMSSMVGAMPLEWEIGGVSFKLPFKTVRTQYLLDLVGEVEQLVGIETPVVGWKMLEGNIGGAKAFDSESRNGVPYGSLTVKVPGKILEKMPIYVGGFGGRDFDRGDWIGGVSANVQLWSF